MHGDPSRLMDYLCNVYFSWIEGFISKKAAERKLMESPKCRSAMYMLRFSDSTITDSQGLKSVFGLVTAAVLMVKKAKGIASGGSRGGLGV